jgi:hypothetical protein
MTSFMRHGSPLLGCAERSSPKAFRVAAATWRREGLTAMGASPSDNPCWRMIGTFAKVATVS